MESFSRVSSRLILPSDTAIPISEFNRLFRQECRFDLCVISPHAATTTPCCTIIADVEPISWAYLFISASFAADQPARSGDINCFHSAPGTPLDWAPASTTDPSNKNAIRLKDRRACFTRSAQLVDFGGKDEIAFGEAVDLVGPGGDFRFAPREQNIGMMSLLFGDGAHFVHERERLLEIGEREGARDVVPVDYLPLRHLLCEGVEVSAR